VGAGGPRLRATKRDAMARSAVTLTFAQNREVPEPDIRRAYVIARGWFGTGICVQNSLARRPKCSG
jgi:hypothetical protein